MTLIPPEDRILVHCGDDRHAKDARFLVCEEDFRFYIDDLFNYMVYKGLDWQLLEAQHQLIEEKDMFDPQDLLAMKAGRFCPVEHKVPDKKPECFELTRATKMVYTASTKTENPKPEPTQELQDIQAMWTMALRKGYGNIVWFGHQRSPDQVFKKKPRLSRYRVSSWSGMIGITRTGAQMLRKRMVEDLYKNST